MIAEQGLTGAVLSSKQQNKLCRDIGARVMHAIDKQADASVVDENAEESAEKRDADAEPEGVAAPA